MTCGDLLQILQIAQIIALLTIGHVSIGIYGSYYLLKSLAEKDSNVMPEGTDVAVVTHVRGDGVLQSYDFPPSARELPFIGLVASGVLGIVFFIVLLFVLIPLGFISNTIRMAIIRSYLAPHARWAPRQRTDHLCLRDGLYQSERCRCGNPSFRAKVNQADRYPACNCGRRINWYWVRGL